MPDMPWKEHVKAMREVHHAFHALDTVDGRNPAPVDMVNIPLFRRFHACWVVQDFFHQQYQLMHKLLCFH